MKINPAKCIFEVASGKFLGYIFSKEGIQVDPLYCKPSRNAITSHYQRNTKVKWLDRICRAIHLALIRQKPEPNEELLIYLATTPYALSEVLLRLDQGMEKPIYYISKTFNSAERNYTKIEKLTLTLIHVTQKLHIYFHAHRVKVLTKKSMESVLKSSKKVGRIERWNAQIEQFAINYEVLSSLKSQVIADFIVDFPLEEDDTTSEMTNIDEDCTNPEDLLKEDNSRRWEIFVDGSVNSQGNGIGIVFTSPTGERIVHCFRLEYDTTNNETVIHGLRLAVEMGLDDVRLTSDSQIVVRQMDGRYKVNYLALQKYSQLVKQYSDAIPKIIWRHICLMDNRHADALAFITQWW